MPIWIFSSYHIKTLWICFGVENDYDMVAKANNTLSSIGCLNCQLVIQIYMMVTKKMLHTIKS